MARFEPVNFDRLTPEDKKLYEAVKGGRPKLVGPFSVLMHNPPLAEAANLLKMPGRRVAQPGEKSDTPGVELEPEEMDVLIAKDRAAWQERATHLHDAAIDVIAAIDAKDGNKVFELGEKIEEACENCHKQYWYPNEVIPPVQADTK